MDGISEILATYNCVSLDEKIQFELDGVVEKEIKQAYCIENLEFCVCGMSLLCVYFLIMPELFGRD